MPFSCYLYFASVCLCERVRGHSERVLESEDTLPKPSCPSPTVAFEPYVPTTGPPKYANCGCVREPLLRKTCPQTGCTVSTQARNLENPSLRPRLCEPPPFAQPSIKFNFLSPHLARLVRRYWFSPFFLSFARGHRTSGRWTRCLTRKVVRNDRSPLSTSPRP